MDRGKRRHRTEKIARKRLAAWLKMAGWGAPSLGLGQFRKESVGNCTCRKRHPGQPRRDIGMCDLCARVRIYRARAQERELRRLVVLRREDGDDDAVAVLSDPRMRDDLWG